MVQKRKKKKHTLENKSILVIWFLTIWMCLGSGGAGSCCSVLYNTRRNNICPNAQQDGLVGAALEIKECWQFVLYMWTAKMWAWGQRCRESTHWSPRLYALRYSPRKKSQLLFEKKKTNQKTVGLLNRGQVQQPCEEQVQPKEIKELIIAIRQQTMTKKMLVKTESVDMTGGGCGGGVQGSDGWGWYDKTNGCIAINFFFFFAKQSLN